MNHIPMKTMPTIFLVLLFLCAGCSTPAYKRVMNEHPAGNAKEFFVSGTLLYDATIKTLCAKNFTIEKEDKESGFILGKKTFQEGRKTSVVLLQGKIIAPSPQAATLYLNAVETAEVAYIADRTRFFLFLIPLPGGGGKEASRITQAEKTIQDKKFYQFIFKAIEGAL